MEETRSHELLVAIEALINAKMIDALSRPDGVSRLVAHRTSGVASQPIRNAERQLEMALSRCLSEPAGARH